MSSVLSWHVTTGSNRMVGVGRCIGISSISSTASTHHQSSIIHHPSSISLWSKYAQRGWQRGWQHGHTICRQESNRQDTMPDLQLSLAQPAPVTDKVAEGPHLRDFPRPRRGPKQPSDSTAEEARDPVMALQPKWCPTISLRLALHCGGWCRRRLVVEYNL